MANSNDEFKGLKLSKDLKDFHHHCSVSLKQGFFEMFEDEFWDFVRRKMQKEQLAIMKKIPRQI